jgi:CRISPR system Cascade subunit CasE
MPYLSKIKLRTNDHGSTGTLIDILLRHQGLAEQHRLVWVLFSEASHAERDFLFRKIDGGGWLVLSQRKPLDHHNIWEIETKTFQPDIRTGQRLAFRLRASPSIATRDEAGRRVRRDAILTTQMAQRRPDGSLPPISEILPTAAHAWLSKKGEGAGFTVDRKELVSDCYVRQEFAKEGEGTVRFRSIDFRGVLTVSNSDDFMPSVMSGFGNGKAYGFGMMLLSKCC